MSVSGSFWPNAPPAACLLPLPPPAAEGALLRWLSLNFIHLQAMSVLQKIAEIEAEVRPWPLCAAAAAVQNCSTD